MKKIALLGVGFTLIPLIAGAGTLEKNATTALSRQDEKITQAARQSVVQEGQITGINLSKNFVSINGVGYLINPQKVMVRSIKSNRPVGATALAAGQSVSFVVDARGAYKQWITSIFISR